MKMSMANSWKEEVEVGFRCPRLKNVRKEEEADLLFLREFEESRD